MKRLTDREVRSQIYGVLASKLRMACIVDGDDIDIDRYHAMQMKIAAQMEARYCTAPRCICQEQHRRGYCTELGCPYALSSHHQGIPHD